MELVSLVLYRKYHPSALIRSFYIFVANKTKSVIQKIVDMFPLQ